MLGHVIVLLCLLCVAAAQSPTPGLTDQACIACADNNDVCATNELRWCGDGQIVDGWDETITPFCCLARQSCIQQTNAGYTSFQCGPPSTSDDLIGGLTLTALIAIAVVIPLAICCCPLLLCCLLGYSCASCKQDPAQFSPTVLTVIPSFMLHERAEGQQPPTPPSLPLTRPHRPQPLPSAPPIASAIPMTRLLPPLPPRPARALPRSKLSDTLLTTQFGPLFDVGVYAICDPLMEHIVAFERDIGAAAHFFRVNILTAEVMQAMARQHTVQAADELNAATMERLAPFMERYFAGRVMAVCCGVVLRYSPLLEDLIDYAETLDKEVRVRTTYAPITPEPQEGVEGIVIVS